MAGVIGFDFGTTNSLISVIDGDRAINLLDGGLPHPSVVSYVGNEVVAGREAKAMLGSAGLGVHGNIVVSPKSQLGKEKIFVEGIARSPRDIVADLVQFIRWHAEQEEPAKDFHEAVVTIPVGMNGYRRSALRDAFRKAGIRIHQFVHEPLAALYGHLRTEADLPGALRDLDRELVLVFDWGGGTLDLTLCRILDGQLVQIRNLGCDTVGGDSIDDLISNHIVHKSSAASGLEGKVNFQAGARQRIRAFSEGAKIELSNADSTLVYVADAFDVESSRDPDLEYDLSRTELEQVCSGIVSKGIGQIGVLLDSVGIEASMISLCLATGGMINMPLIRSRLREIFGPERLQVSPRGATIIAEGAAWVAADRRQLTLSKPLELVTARNTFVPIVKAGTKMPREGEVIRDRIDLYCSDPRDGIAKFQFASPFQPGTPVAGAERAILDVMTIAVDSRAEPFLERLQLDFRVDENLIVTAEGMSQVMKDRASVQLHDLEFGLALPTVDSGTDTGSRSDAGELPELDPVVVPTGSLSLRANIVARKNKFYVPGELLYEYDRFYFDTRMQPPEIQVKERLYYEPCSMCGRRSNDPLCDCGAYLERGEWRDSRDGQAPA